MALPADSKLGPYQVISLLGAGGMGEVYLAHDPRLDRRVAIKLLPVHLASDTVARERLRREAMAAAALDHPFICKIFEIGENNGALFIVMEYVNGETLFARLRTGRLSQTEALRIAGEVAEALEEAHQVRFVHRDLKPTNLMLTRQGRVKVMDFGLAKRFGPEQVEENSATLTAASPALTELGAIIGTPDYMSPEQVKGAPIDQRSDLFSFGIILAELLTGAHPFRRSSWQETMSSILRDAPALASTGTAELPQGLMVLIRRLLAKAPEERYQSIREVRADMGRLATLAQVPEPASAIRIPLIGRDAERIELLRQMEDALAGRGSLAMIGGEPGIGKTHLIGEILAEARRRGAMAFIGHCYEMEGAPPYVPFVEMLEYGARVTPPDTFRYAVGDAAPEVAKLMPELRRMFPDIPPAIELPPEQQRRFLFNAYRDFIDRSARLTPIVAVFEDLHWTDEPTLLLLQHLAQTASTTPILMIGTYRDVELEVTRPFAKTLESLVRQKLATRISLRRLPVTGVEAMLAAMSGQTPPPSLARVVFEETEGNPFFVEEVFRHLAEEGKLFDEKGAWRAGLRVDQLQVPEGVRLVLGRRLDRLGEEARRVLTTAAVVGRSFSLRLLEDLENRQPDAALEAVEEAERAHLVVAEPAGRETRYRFVHELVRQTLSGALSLPRRQRLHGRVADAIERVYAASLDSHASVLSHHLYQAGAAADPDKTVQYLTLAAQRATASAAHEEALSHLDNALSLMEEERSGRMAELQVQRATALRSLARMPQAKEAYERAMALFDALGDKKRFAETALPLAWIHGWESRLDRACAILDNALDRLGPGQSPLHLLLLSTKAHCTSGSGDIDAALSLLADIEKLWEPSAEADLNGWIWASETHLHFHAMQLDLGMKACLRSIRAFEAAGDVWGQTECLFMKHLVPIQLGQLAVPESVFLDDLQRAERVGHQNSVWSCMFNLGLWHCAKGDLKAAEHAAREAVSYGRSFQLGWNFISEVFLGNVIFLLGQIEEAIERFRRVVDSEPPVNFYSGYAQACLASAMAQAGKPGALELLRATYPSLPRPGRTPSLGSWYSLAKVVPGLASLNCMEEAAALHPVAEQLVASGVLCSNDITLFRTVAGIAAACARNWSCAEEHHQTAMHQATSAPYVVAQPQARAWYAEMLLARKEPGDAARARGLLSQAVSQFESIGMPFHARRASARLA
ncbi:MAG: protein kinase [Acidobacteriia bacterium]|nr:protein kinase [Terriglobia bacterium]